MILHGTKNILALLALTASLATAQAPQVPLDHYGPPICNPAAKPSTSRMTVAKAEAIEAAGAADPTALPSTTPLENFDVTRIRLKEYADCVGETGCYWNDLDTQYKRAETALRHALLSTKPNEKLALILDIDETTLSGYCEMQREDYGFIKSMSYEWVVTPQAAVAIPGALRLFNLAKSQGIDVFFITGRPEQQTEATAHNLESAGFHGWKGLALRNAAEHDLPVTLYKSARRRQILNQGYRLLLNVGDQWSDLTGTPKAEVSVKLPNPFYFLP
jgi:phosphoglycolate phosphatase-like HAD superfamily hydrolase